MKDRLFAVVRIILFISIFATLIGIMNFYLVQSNWASIDRWEQYSAKDDIDTLFVGSSVGWVVVPRTIDGLNSCRCVNLSTPNQFYKTSLEAVRFVSKQQPLSMVVLLTGFEGLESSEDYAAAMAFNKAQYETAPLIQREAAAFALKMGRYTDPKFLTSVDSINAWFDWVESFTYSIPEIYKNVAYRRSRKDPGYALDFTKKVERKEPQSTTSVKDDISKAQSLDLSHIDIDNRSLERLDEMASYLTANDVRFVVIVTPHRSDAGEELGEEYGIIDSFLEDFVTKRGGEYFNIDSDPALRELLPDNMFMDREHIVDEGNDIVSTKIAELLR